MNPHTNPFVSLNADTPLKLPRSERFSLAGHLWGQEEIDALTLALAARRPLLVRGEAGSGKSQIARAASWILNQGDPLVEVIHPRFEAQDLLYRFDTVARLADAQVQALDLSNEKYVTPGRLWEAINAMNAKEALPVVLIDEIDKADADLPNALLDVLGNRSFSVPPRKNLTVKANDERLPFVVITTNEERELPAAFVRRCVVLNVSPPDADDAFCAWLITRGRVHPGLKEIDEQARTHAADQVLADRKAAHQEGCPCVGLAEYIDLLTALQELTANEPQQLRPAKQIEWLQKLSAYALVKNAKQSQKRVPVPVRKYDE